MKKGIILAALAIATFSCKQAEKKAEPAAAAEPAKVEATGITGSKAIDVAKSVVKWKGTKKIGEFHEGTINLASGNIDFNNGVPSAGMFTIDMKTISSTDLEGEYAQKLNGHLMADDFFGVENHPTATFKITGAEAAATAGTYTVTGDLTIKGITQPLSFPLTVSEDGATAAMTFDRTKYDIKYGSGSFFDNLGDKVINDDIEIEVNLAM